jgi:3',5'-cyclic AMP phosphodiesterase CpdA
MQKRVALLAIAVVLFAVSAVNAGEERNQKAIDRILKNTNQDTLVFVIMGDNRNGDDTLKQLLAMVEKDNPEFVIILGDFVPTGLKWEYENYLKLIAPCTVPIIAILGNHEVAAPGGREIYAELFGAEDFSFDHKGCRFICFDNSRNLVTDKQLEWLDKLTAVDSTTAISRKFVLAHVPPKLGNWDDHVFEHNAGTFIKLMAKNKVDYAVFGHIHLYARRENEGTVYMITAGAGAPLYPNYSYGVPKYHYVKFTVTKDSVKDELVLLNK